MTYVVSGYYTPDYAVWAKPLIASLEKHGQPYDFASLPRSDLTWEGNCLLKAGMLLRAMAKHPEKTIVWVDVDCTVHGDLSPLANLPGDIGLRFEMKRRKGRALELRAHSGTMVVNPTPRARRFIQAWASRSELATHGEDDEATLAQTIIGTHDVAICQLHGRWFAGGGRRATDPVIVHDWASRDLPKVHKVMRFLHRHLGTPALQQ